MQPITIQTEEEGEMKHTPGPWIISERRDAPRTVKIGTGEDGWLGLAQAFGDTQEEANANASLIAAAPELLKCCKAVLDAWHAKDSNFEKKEPAYLQPIRIAIKKAEGGGQ